MQSLYAHEVTLNNGKQITFGEYKDNVVLVVNTASKCGFTPQYKGLEALYQTYKDKGLVVIGFPCNQFGSQEPGSDSEISDFCDINYGVTFPLTTKVDVNGDDAHPLFEQLKTEAPGILGSKSIKWNFTKFLIDKTGTVISRYAPNTKPEEIEKDIRKLLD